MLQVLEKEKFVDTIFVLGYRSNSKDKDVKLGTFRVNRLFFGIISKRFEKMLHSKVGKVNYNEPGTFRLNDIDAKGFESICLYAYGNNPKITADNVLCIMDICEKYQITELKNFVTIKFKKVVKLKHINNIVIK